jgi:hypothetical protein
MIPFLAPLIAGLSKGVAAVAPSVLSAGASAAVGKAMSPDQIGQAMQLQSMDPQGLTEGLVQPSQKPQIQTPPPPPIEYQDPNFPLRRY